MKRKCEMQAGFSILEIMLAAAIFVLFSSGAMVAVISALYTNRLGAETTIANQFNAEGMEAVRSIKNQSFITFASKSGLGNQGVLVSGGVWTWNGTSNTLAHNSTDTYIRTIAVTSVQRDAIPNGNIVSSGGVYLDGNTYKVVVTTTWKVNTARQNSVVLTEYMTNWKGKKGGMLAYSDTATGSNAILTKTFDAGTSTWSSATTLFPDGSVASSNALQVMRMFSSSTRNEKIILSRHSNAGTTQTNIYASVWNGSTWTKQTLATWAAASANDHLDFDGTYVANGDFIVVYTDNTTTPKFRTWNGSAWSAQLSVGATALTGTIQWTVVEVRPGTNEVMAAFLTSSNNTDTYYYNGTTPYAAANWTLFTIHATLAPVNTRRLIDFAFSTNTMTTGALIYADSSTDKNITVRVFVANGTGGGSWGTAVNAASTQTNNLAAMAIVPRPTANEFQGCDKDAGTTPTILCYKITFSGTIPTISTSTTVAAATDTGGQRSFDISYENISGDPLIAVYSDNTAIPKFKKDTAGTWDGSATSITTTGSPGIFKGVRVIQQDQGDDMVALMSDANMDIFSIFYNGATNTMYTTPAAKAYTAHGVNGVGTANFWFDFAWDKF